MTSRRLMAVAMAIALLGCDDAPDADGGTGLDAGGADAGGADGGAVDAGGADAGALGCATAMSGFPRPLGLPEPEPNGVFDPDLVRDPDTGRLWLAHSAVNGAPGSGRVSTHLSYSDDDGATWCHRSVVNRSDDLPLDALPEGVTGERAHWSHETSALVHDPGADAAARWRLLWHRYLHVEDPDTAEDRRFAHGWIAQRTASTPEGLLEAPEQKLFSSAAYHADPAVTAYNDAAPGGAPLLRLDSLPALNGCLVFTEPALLAHDGALYAALFCARSATAHDIVLLRLDHTTGDWSYVGTAATHADAATLDASYTGLNASDLFAFDGGHRLLLTPTSETRYRGCVVFEIDLATGALRDDTGDGPDPQFILPLGDDPARPFGGACTFLEGSALGLIYGEVRFSIAPEFQLTASGNTTL